MNIVFMTKVKSKSGKEQEVLQASPDVAKAARSQASCVDYRILRSPEDSSVTMNFEIWSSEEARNAFNNGPDAEKFIAVVSDAFAELPQPISYQEVAEA
jgi:quinol monooxygenase YgiN